MSNEVDVLRRSSNAALLIVWLLASCSGVVGRAAHCQGIPDFDLWATDLDGNVTRLTDEPGADGFADWSPDGERIAFAASRDGNCEIYVMAADGSNQINLTNSDSDELYPSWSPDGTRIVFASTEAGGAQLFVLEVETGDRTQLTDSGLIHNFPDWSPDGSMIVFSGGIQPPGPEAVHDIYVIPAVGGVEEVLTLQSELLVAPQWSPDGTKIAYFDHDSPLQVWVMDADGSGTVELTWGGHMSWAPGGDQIVFDREVGDGDVDLSVVALKGPEPMLLIDSAGLDTIPAWSPDGETIVFSSDRP